MWGFKKLYIKLKTKSWCQTHSKTLNRDVFPPTTMTTFSKLKSFKKIFSFLLMNEYFHWGNKKESMALRIHFYERDLTFGWFQYHFIMFLLESQDVKLYSSVVDHGSFEL